MAAKDGATGEVNLQERSTQQDMPGHWDEKLDPILARLESVCHEEFVPGVPGSYIQDVAITYLMLMEEDDVIRLDKETREVRKLPAPSEDMAS